MIRSLCLIVLAVCAASCAQADGPRSVGTAGVAEVVSVIVASSTSLPRSTVTPQAVVSTGIASLDELIRLELAGDGRALADRLEMSPEPCTFHPEPLGYPLCGDDEVEGQSVDVFPEGNCEGFGTRPDKAREEFAVPHPKTELYAVLAPTVSGSGAETGYELVFDYVPPAPRGGFTYVVRGDRIVSRFGACNGVGVSELARDRLQPLEGTGIAADRSLKIAPVDGIIAAVESGNVDQLNTRVSYRSSRCTQRYSQGDGLACLPNEAEKSRVDVFSADGCVGTLLRKSRVEALLADAVNEPTPKLYAIGLPSLADSQAFNYRLMFARGDGGDARGFELDVLDGRIVRFDSGCGPIARRAARVTTFLVPPAVSPSPSAAEAPASIGIADLDDVVRLVASGDVSAIIARTKTTVVPCGRPGDGYGIVLCGNADPSGTPIESIAGSCRYESVSDVAAYRIPHGLELYRVFRVSDLDQGEYFQRFAPAYTLVFSKPFSSPPIVGLDFFSVDVAGSQIVGIGGSCAGSPFDSASDQIVRPPEER